MIHHEEKDTYIVGCGASGMLAGIAAAESGMRVGILEANPSPGRKLAATGSGRGNLTNLAASAADYDCANPALLAEALEHFDPKMTRQFLNQLGIPTMSTDDGWVYPLSGSASNVAETLYSQLAARGVVAKFHTLITDIQLISDGIRLCTADPDNIFTARRVIVAAGSPAYPQLGARDNLYRVLGNLGHTINNILPALAPIELAGNTFHQLQGVRVDAGVKVLVEGKPEASTLGNIIFTSWGINGPGAMNISHHIHRHHAKGCQVSIDFLAGNEELLGKMYHQLRQSPLPMRVLFNGLFPAKVSQFLLQLQKLDGNTPLSSFDQRSFEELVKKCRDVRAVVKGTRGFRFSQLASGGVPLNEVDARTMASRKVHGLFLAGEVLDVVGPCGGFNLQWAWTSGYLAGKGSAISQSN